jgi:hypothetical protein
MTDQEASRYRAGQVWTYHTRPGEEDSRVWILKVEHYEKAGTIVHIMVDNVRVNITVDQGEADQVISHMPFAQAALDRSVITLEPTTESLPDFMEGYNHWKTAWDNEKAGCWTVDVKDAVEGINSSLTQQQ